MTKKKILVVGEQDRLAEFSLLTLQNADIDFLDQTDSDFHITNKDMEGFLTDYPGDKDEEEEDKFDEVDWDEIEIVIDLGLDDNPQNLFNYVDHSHLIVIGCAAKMTLAEMSNDLPGDMKCWLFGINSLPTFINRPVWEISALNEKEKPLLDSVLKDLGVTFEWVDDRVGMATPRVIAMIINEAYFMLGEGTAATQDIDSAMKLGTNYPYGPFEWGQKIGLNNVLDILEKVYDDSFDPRYKVAPELKKAFFREK